MFFVSGNPAGVRSVPKAGGSVTTLVNGDSPSRLVLDATSVYYLANSPPSVVKVNKDGTGKQTLSTTGGTSIAVSSTWLVWVIGTSVTRANKDGTSPTSIYGPGTAGSPMVADEFNLFFSEKIALKKGSYGGGFPQTIAVASSVGDIAVDADSVVWTTSTMVHIADKSSLKLGSPVASGLLAADGVAVDAAGVYWSSYAGVQSATKTGTNKTTIATGQGGVKAIATDSTHVYWASMNNGTIMKATK